MSSIYLDYNATTPISNEVAEQMRPYLDQYFGNPSSSHHFGVETKKAVEKARKQVASLLNCNTDEIVFTSGGTESNNYAIKGIAFEKKNEGNHIITSQIEHPAVIEVCKFLETQGFEVTYLAVDQDGLLNAEDVSKAIKPTTILITVMHANNEVGTIQPIKEISQIAKNHGIVFHSDAAQSVGKVAVDVNELGVDLLSVAGHKLYAPKGIGVLYVKRGVKLVKFMHGANHEQNLRAGTENVLEIVGLGAASELAHRDLEKNMKHFASLRNRLRDALIEEFPQAKLNGHSDLVLPNTLNISFPGIEADSLLGAMGGEVAASAGAACHTDDIEVSSVLKAMDVPIDFAMGTLRLSVGRSTSEQDIDMAIDHITKAVYSLSGNQNETIVSDEDYKLTQFTHGLGCACKLRPQDLETVLKNIPHVQNPDILVGTANADDAAVYALDGNKALVQTLDFFTPVVDDPFDFGAIAAANALSDVYAMGAKPLFALNIVGFPSKRLPLTVLEKILQGAQSKATEAGIAVLGGHSVEDTEPKYGMVVSGIIDQDKIYSNEKARLGDVLILTKSIGTGIMATAAKRGLLEEGAYKNMVSLMSELNKTAADVMKNYNVSTCTDVTGFGLLGHLAEITTASKTDCEVKVSDVPFLPEAVDLAIGGTIPGGTVNNRAYVACNVNYDDAIPEHEQVLLCDAQTSGGLLIAVHPEDAEALKSELLQNGVSTATQIGRLTRAGNGVIHVIP
jgi:cysteine desulfurase NifS/selenium donor protein